MKELTIDGNNFHDGIIYNLSLSFEAKEIVLILKQWSGLNDGRYTLSKLTLKNVAWQDFNQFNVLWGIEISNSFEEFENVKKEYLNRMKNYFGTGVLENIKEEKSFQYFYLQASAGLEGFIICKDLNVEAIKMDK